MKKFRVIVKWYLLSMSIVLVGFSLMCWSYTFLYYGFSNTPTQVFKNAITWGGVGVIHIGWYFFIKRLVREDKNQIKIDKIK